MICFHLKILKAASKPFSAFFHSFDTQTFDALLCLKMVKDGCNESQMNPKCPDMFRQAWIRMLLDNSQTFFLSLTLSACKHRHMIFTKTYIWFGSAGFDMKPCFLYLRRCFFFFFLCAMFKSNEKNYSVLSAMSFEDLFWKAPSGNWRDIPCFYLAELEFKLARETLFTHQSCKKKWGKLFLEYR